MGSKMDYTSYFVELFKRENLDKIPLVDIGERTGWTDYIDFLNMEDFLTKEGHNNVIRGVDKYKRPFISFLYKTVKDGEEFDYNIVTIFQRYTDDNFWMYGGRLPAGLFSTGCNFNNPHNRSEENLFKTLAELLDKREVSYEYYSLLSKQRHCVKLILN
jgi:hypothetical protein